MRVARLVLLAIGCLFSQFATSASLYRVTDLGTVSGLAPFSQGFGLNDSGEAVGRTGASITSPFTSQSGSMTALPLPPGGRSSGSAEALDVNNSGVAVGDFTNSTGGVQAAKWQNGVATNLGVTATDQSFAWAINDVGTIVGYGNAQGGGAFMWNPDGSVVKIFNGQAYAINNAGQVAGEVNNQAVLWQNGITRNLGYLPGYTSSHAFGINDAGAVVGWSDFGHPEAFVWINGVMTDLGNLSGGTSGVAWDINDAGQIVGNAGYPCVSTGHAYLWSPGHGIQNLDFPGAVCTRVYGINNSGQAVGLYTATASGPTQGFTWSSASGFQTLPSLGGTTEGLFINASGQVSGRSVSSVDHTYHAFLWSPTGGIQDIGVPPRSNRATYPVGLNNKGEVVGVVSYANGSGSLFRFDWTPKTPITPINVVEFSALNDAGQIIGSRGPGPNFQSAVLLSPRVNVILSATPNPSKFGKSVTFTAKAKSFLGAPPDGEMVKFQEGATVLGMAPLTGGVAKFTTTGLSVGTHAVTATYVGDVHYDPSVSNVFNQVVNP